MKNWKQWLKTAGIRAVRTMAQTAAGLLTASAALAEIDWLVVLSATALAGLACVLMSIGGLPEVSGE